MNHIFNITITTNVSTSDIRSTTAFPYSKVIDLRCINSGIALAVNENVSLKLRSFHVDYQQAPINLKDSSSRQQNDLFRTLTEETGNVLVVTDDVVLLEQFCQELDIPFKNRGLHLVVSTPDSVSPDRMPIEAYQQPNIMNTEIRQIG